MGRWLTTEQRVFIVEEMAKTGSTIATRRSVKLHFNTKVSLNTIGAVFRKWKKNGTIRNLHKGNSGRHRSATANENVQIAEAHLNDQNVSLRKLSAATQISRSSLHRILRTNLQLKPYKIQESQELKPGDCKARLNFCKKIKQLIESGEIDVSEIIFSDESHVYLKSSPNKQNVRQWLAEKPKTRSPVPLHSAKVTVWCGFNSTKIFGPYFFENSETGEALTVTKERYTAMLAEIFPDDSDDVNTKTVFQQDGAPAHTSRMVIDFLNHRFSGRLISKSSNLLWPPRSPDLNPLDFYFWSHMKQKVHEGSPQTRMEVKNLISAFVSSISPDLLGRVIQQFNVRIRRCIAAKGGLFE